MGVKRMVMVGFGEIVLTSNCTIDFDEYNPVV